MSKDFKNENPAMAFISKKSLETRSTYEDDNFEQNKPPKGYKIDPKYIETKSKRVGVLMQPSVFESLKELAFEKRMSVNEAINEAVLRYLEA